LGRKKRKEKLCKNIAAIPGPSPEAAATAVQNQKNKTSRNTE